MSKNPQKPADYLNPDKGRVAATPTGGTPPADPASPDKFTTIFKEKGWTMGVYENEADGTQGFILTNGKTAFHFDQSGNMIMATGKPLGGCGGKAIMTGTDKMEKFHSVAIEVTGNDDEEETTTNASGNTETKKKPAYSITVYGDVAIESVGGDIGMKGDNVTISANETLTLISRENLTLQSNGNLNLKAHSTQIDGAYLRKRLTAGEYVEGAGELKVEQTKPGAMVSIETPGSLKYVVNGNYELGVKGDFAINTEGAFALSSNKNYFVTVKGNADEKIDGKKKVYVGGKSTVVPIDQKEAFLTEVATSDAGNVSYKLDADSNLEMNSKTGSLKQTAKIDVDIEATGLVKVVGKQIYLN
jgi:hypothetical protein